MVRGGGSAAEPPAACGCPSPQSGILFLSRASNAAGESVSKMGRLIHISGQALLFILWSSVRILVFAVGAVFNFELISNSLLLTERQTNRFKVFHFLRSMFMEVFPLRERCVGD
jgi:hypothetical protein